MRRHQRQVARQVPALRRLEHADRAVGQRRGRGAPANNRSARASPRWPAAGRARGAVRHRGQRRRRARPPASTSSTACWAAASSPGGVMLIGGDPGIGKSTLLLQAARCAAARRAARALRHRRGKRRAGRAALAPARARPLAGAGAGRDPAREDPRHARRRTQPAIAVIDSIQTVYSDQLTSAPGSVAQVRECAAHLTRFAKASGTAIVLVGHVTKEGALAGPRVLEHMVDTVLYFEGDTHSSFRLVRAIKNRFGAVNEIGVFAMTERGLKGVANPSAIFLSPARRAGARQLRAGHARRHAADAGRDPGAGRLRRAEPAAPVGRPRARPARDAAGRAAPPRGRGLRATRTCSSTRSAACASASRRPTWP